MEIKEEDDKEDAASSQHKQSQETRKAVVPPVIGKSDQGDINVPASVLHGMKLPSSRASNRSQAPEQINAMLEEINATGGKRLTMSVEELPNQKDLD